MKKIISLVLIAVLLCVCTVVSVSAEISPTAPIVDKTIIVDATPVPSHGGTATPTVDDPYVHVVGSDDTVTLVATPNDGWKFTHWEFVTGDYDIIEGSLTSSTITILPKGDADIHSYAYFVEEGETVPSTEPQSKPPVTPDDNDKSPTTGDITPVLFAGSAVVLMLGFAVIALKKKAC